MEASENLARSRHCDKAMLLLSQVFSFFSLLGMLFRGKIGCFLTEFVLKIQPRIFVLNHVLARRSAFGDLGWSFNAEIDFKYNGVRLHPLFI
jgi:hypothetical protein